MTFDPRTTGNLYPAEFKPHAKSTLSRWDKGPLVEHVVRLEGEHVKMIAWTVAVLDELGVIRGAMASIRNAANATIKAYEEQFDAQEAQIAALTAALVATRREPTSRVEVKGGTGVYVRTDTWRDRKDCT